MPDRSEPATLWRDQPQEEPIVNTDQFAVRRAQELHSSTRSEILMSIAAAVFFIAVVGLRIAPLSGRITDIAAVAAAWIAITLYAFRRRIWSGPDRGSATVAATGLEYYRSELEQRRRHLRNAWLWHGPLLLACVTLVAILAGKNFPSFARLSTVLPLVVVLALWTGYGLFRRRRAAKALQEEINDLAK